MEPQTDKSLDDKRKRSFLIQLLTVCKLVHTNRPAHADIPEGFMEECLSSFLPTSYPQLCCGRRAHETEVPGSLTSSEQLSVRDNRLLIEQKREQQYRRESGSDRFEV